MSIQMQNYIFGHLNFKSFDVKQKDKILNQMVPSIDQI
jgi:hypothetical protein